MASVEKISIALPPEMVEQVRDAVETGEYASSSEVVREALRDWTQKRSLHRQGLAELRRAWRQAVKNAEPGIGPGKVLDRLEQKYRAMGTGAAKGKREECA
jgi:antitoxin ParD1/3/4